MKKHIIVNARDYRGVVYGLYCSWAYRFRKDRQFGHTGEYLFEGDVDKTEEYVQPYEEGQKRELPAMFCGYYRLTDENEFEEVALEDVEDMIRSNPLVCDKCRAFCNRFGFDGNEEFIDWVKIATA